MLIARKNTFWIYLRLWNHWNFFNLSNYELIKSSTILEKYSRISFLNSLQEQDSIIR